MSQAPGAATLAPLFFLSTLLPLSAAQAQGRSPTVITTVEDSTTGAADQELIRALELSIVLHIGPDSDWIVGAPERASGASGCPVISISGTHGESTSNYVLRLVDDGASTTSELSVPRDIPTSMLADALLLKCLFLLEVSHESPDDACSPEEEPIESPITSELNEQEPRERSDEQSPPPQRITERRYSIALGVIGAFGVEEDNATFGLEAVATFRLRRWLALRLAVGGHFIGWWEKSSLDYWTLPIRAMLGLEWDIGRRWQIGAYAGYILDIVWVDTNPENEAPTVGTSMGASLEARVSVIVHDRIALGITVQAAGQKSNLDLDYGNPPILEPWSYRHPHWEISSSFEVIIRL